MSIHWLRVAAAVAVVLGLAAPGVAGESSGRIHTAETGVRGSRSCRLVIVADVSGSMAQDQRWQRLAASTAALIVSLPDGSEVGIVLFHHSARVLVPLTRLTADNRDRLLAPLDRVKPDGGTDILAGLEQGLNLLDGGGSVVLVSDGLQTGDSDTPQPESVWREPARALARRARKLGVTVHTIGLGPDVAADPLLRLLASGSGGQFFSVREARDLLAQFVELAGQFGQFWARSRQGEFRVALEEEVVLVAVAEAGRLRPLKDSRSEAVEPVLRISRGGVRAERFHLLPGSYRFEPGKAAPAHLLRPMRLSWTFPGATLPAGRNVSLVFRARAARGEKAQVSDLALSFQPRFGEDKAEATIEATGSADGEVVVPLRTPAGIQPVRAAVGAEQQGWRYRVGVWSGQLVLPPPLEVTLAEPTPRLTSLVTRGNEDSIVAQAEATCETHGHTVELRASTSSAHIRVSPSRIRLKGGKQTIALTLVRQANAPRDLETALRFQVQSDDLVAARINKIQAVEWPLRWRHRRPSLRIQGLRDGEPLHIIRGRQALLPLVVEGTDLDSGTGVVLSAQTPSGIDVVWGSVSVGGVRSASVLKAGEDAALRIQVGKDALPGRRLLELIARPSNPTVPINSRRELRFRIPIVIAPVEVRVRLLPESADWSLLAPIEAVARQAVVEVVAADGGALPPSIDLIVAAEAPVASVVREEGQSAAAWPARYTLTVPAQTQPSTGVVRFHAAGDQVRCLQDAVVRVRVKPIVLKVAVGPVEPPRFAGALETLFAWLRPAHRFSPEVRVEGDGAAEAGCRWDVVAHRSDGAEEILQPATAQSEFTFTTGADYNVRLSSAYKHTVFLPSAELRLPVREKTVAPPPWMWIAAGAAGFLVLACLVRPFPVRVLAEPGGMRRALGNLPLNRVTTLRGLKLRLTRGWHGQTLLRSRRDASGARVVLDSATLGRVDLEPGKSCHVHRGDTIEVTPPEGDPCLIEVLSGGPPPGLSSDPLVADDLDFDRDANLEP
ncbi:MAG TPA: vWA domain-containing protein [Gemmataceae bacterium]|jgi:Mg-chelatase subunit ChlD